MIKNFDELNSKSAGASSLMLAFIEFFIVRQADNKHIVINNIKQIIVFEKTVVLILLLNCIKVKLFNHL